MSQSSTNTSTRNCLRIESHEGSVLKSAPLQTNSGRQSEGINPKSCATRQLNGPCHSEKQPLTSGKDQLQAGDKKILQNNEKKSSFRLGTRPANES
ncbi:hypothetical protein [Alistipes sp. An31A]|jgi:hypothetical protein|uniref:hypothetical protein n=1 Tax=Alistipes sp. An31A TaxID=1965631 RepID=UPI00117785EA|nr:hypothetical protein [Alistipes sp. An31A]HIV33177.1 hypothetical protein [Candidatus Alistipes excrementigallinarum]